MPRGRTKVSAAKGRTKPALAMALLIVAGLCVILGGFATSIFLAKLTSLMGIGGIGGVAGVLGIVCGVLMMISALMLNTTDPKRIRRWSIIALVFTFISLINAGGFIVGFILGLIGGTLGLTHNTKF